MPLLPCLFGGPEQDRELDVISVPSPVELRNLQLWAQIQSDLAENSLSRLYAILIKMQKFVWQGLLPKGEWDDLADWYRIHCEAFRHYAVRLPSEEFLDGSGI